MRLSKLILLLIMACVFVAEPLSMQAQPPYRRRNINTFTAAEQLELRQLMMQYIDNTIVNEHLTTTGIHCQNGVFLTWHRGYIDRMEAWLMSQTNGTKYLPLPKWDPHDVAGIPNAFFNNLVTPGSAVMSPHTPLVNQNISGFGNFNLNQFNSPTICATYTAGTTWRPCTGNSFGTAFDNFAQAVELQHNPVHGNINGVMTTYSSPAAAIFWLWHAFVDDLYRYYQCTCQGAEATDLYIKDNNADVGDEPNTTVVGNNYWSSPDIWVRQNQDPIVGGRYQHEDDANRHENPEYKLSGPNYVYVRIRNLGCATVPAGTVNLRTYWSKASSGVWVWPADWTNTPPLIPPHGDYINVAPIPVPTLAPGQQWVAEVPWTVPDPALYPLDPNHFCLLARLESAADPMTFVETPSVWDNTRNNNNIAWKNVMVYDVDPFNIIAPHDKWDKFFFKLVDARATAGKLRFDFNGNPAVRYTIDLGRDLYDAWVAGGRDGKGITALEGTQIRIDESGATIEDIRMSKDKTYTPGVQTYLENRAAGGAPDVGYGDVISVDVTQYELVDKADNYTIIGGLTYELRAVKDKATDGPAIVSVINVTKTSCPQSADGAIKLVVPVAGNYTYWWSNGAVTRDVGGLAAGTYTVHIRDAAGVVETHDIEVLSNSTLALDMDGTNSSCGNANGSVRVGVTGGKVPYRYQWYRDGLAITGATANSLQKVVAAKYSVQVTDAAGCTVTGYVTVSDVMAMLEVFATAEDASSEDASDGAAEAVAVGMPPYRYQWSNGAASARIEGLTPGEYTVTVTDAMGCSVQRTVTVSYPQLIQGVDRSNISDAARISALVPNPANDRVEVRYALMNAGMARIEIYDDLGRMVDLVFGGFVPAGENAVFADTRELPAGRYTVRLQFASRMVSMPLVIVR